MESLLAWAPKASGFWGILIGAGRELLLLDHAPCIRPTWTTSPTTPVVEADPYAYPQPHTAPHQPCTRPPVGGASTRQSHTHTAAYHPPIYFTPSHCKHPCPVVLTPVVLNKKKAPQRQTRAKVHIYSMHTCQTAYFLALSAPQLQTQNLHSHHSKWSALHSRWHCSWRPLVQAGLQCPQWHDSIAPAGSSLQRLRWRMYCTLTGALLDASTLSQSALTGARFPQCSLASVPAP